MSETVMNGIGTATVAACAAGLGVAADTARALYRGLAWLSEQGQRELERLEQELSAPVTHVTTAEARKELGRQFASIRNRAMRYPGLQDHVDQVANLLAVKHSALGAFLTASQWESLCAPSASRQVLEPIIDRAAKRLTQTNAQFIARSIVEVATHTGFDGQRFNRQVDGKQTLVLKDPLGRALVAEVRESEEGARLNLDLTGFGDGSCHEVMDRILKGLAGKDIRLGQIRRRSHYRRKGLMPSALEFRQNDANKSGSPGPTAKRQAAELRRRQKHLQVNHQTGMKR